MEPAIRAAVAVLLVILAAGCSGVVEAPADRSVEPFPSAEATAGEAGSASPSPDPSRSPRSSGAWAALGRLPVKGRAPKTGYSRAQFGPAWTDVDRNGCDTRNDILRRDLAHTRAPWGCAVLSGTLADPYTGTSIYFVRGGPSEVDIDHVVAMSNAWQTGAFAWAYSKRIAFANDPLNLLAVESAANRQKGDGDAATWLPANKSFRCAYVARQIAVKTKYHLWVTAAERDAAGRVLERCPGQGLPVAGPIPID